MNRRSWWALAAAAVLTVALAAAWGISRIGRFSAVSPGPVLVSADGRVITLADRSASCFSPRQAVVTESASAVTIVERAAPDHPPAGCAAAFTQLLGTSADSWLKTDWPGTTFPWQAVQVRGHRGWLARDRLTWYEGGQSILMVTGGPMDESSGAGVLLLAVARGLRSA